MIKVIIERHSDRSFSLLEMEGHAGFDERGKDIVCAGVSAVVFGTLEAINQMTKMKELDVKTDKQKGRIKVEFPFFFSRKTDKITTQNLLEGMLISLRKIEDTYGQYIEIKEEE
jgi:uncharacterized protein